ncbi:MAG: hypothetical protein AB3N16_15285 [Flavobacteriaceae bacterium]
MAHYHKAEIDPFSFVFSTETDDTILDIQERMVAQDLDQDLLQRIIDVLWKTIV